MSEGVVNSDFGKLKKAFIEAVVLLAFTKSRKKRWRNILRNMDLVGDFKSFLQFILQERRGRVLYLELSDAHGEIAPGYIKYFQDLGCSVDVVMDSSVARENPLYCIDGVRFFSTNPVLAPLLLRAIRKSDYQIIFVGTNELYQYKRRFFCDVYRSFCEEHPSKMLIVEHDLKNIEKSFYLASLYKNRRLVVIRNFSDDPLLSEVNPHFFGCFESDARSTEDVTTFVVAGGLGLERRNPALLVEGVRYLLGKGIDDFRVVVVGSGRPDGFPDDVAAKVLWMGRLDYPKLYETVRSSSFFLPLLDPDMQEHHKYRTSVSSGSIQLIYGCLIIPVISRVFAVAYGFSEETCVVYDGNEIGMAMERAVEMQRDTLMQMKDNLIDKRKEIQSASLNRISFFF